MTRRGPKFWTLVACLLCDLGQFLPVDPVLNVLIYKWERDLQGRVVVRLIERNVE